MLNHSTRRWQSFMASNHMLPSRGPWLHYSYKQSLAGRRAEAASGAERGPGAEARNGQGNGNGTLNGTVTGTGTATGNTLGAGNSGTATGATSHTTAQVGLDGCLVEPSQQERRAQALHKYKQKRKVRILPSFLQTCTEALRPAPCWKPMLS